MLLQLLHMHAYMLACAGVRSSVCGAAHAHTSSAANLSTAVKGASSGTLNLQQQQQQENAKQRQWEAVSTHSTACMHAWQGQVKQRQQLTPGTAAWGRMSG